MFPCINTSMFIPRDGRKYHVSVAILWIDWFKMPYTWHKQRSHSLVSSCQFLGLLKNTITCDPLKRGKWDGWGKEENFFFIFKGPYWSISRYSRTDRLIQINGINGTKQVRHDQRTSTLFIKVDKGDKNEMIHISNQKIDSDQVNYLHLLTISYPNMEIMRYH